MHTWLMIWLLAILPGNTQGNVSPGVVSYTPFSAADIPGQSVETGYIHTAYRAPGKENTYQKYSVFDEYRSGIYPAAPEPTFLTGLFFRTIRYRYHLLLRQLLI